MLPTHELDRLRQAAMLGLSRQSLSMPERLQSLIGPAAPQRDALLSWLALAGQQSRYRRPSAQTADVPEVARRLHDDRRPIMPEPARRALRRLTNGIYRGLADAVLTAAVRRIMRSGFRPHPFDLPRLIGSIANDARCLGLAERAYLVLGERRPGATSNSLAADITPANWSAFPKALRIAFLRQMRRDNPAAARAMLIEAYQAEPAPMRADLLAALEIGLGGDDLPLLEKAAADRAEGVRATAGRLIASVPGTPAFAARLAEAARCFAPNGNRIIGMLKRTALGSGTDIVFTPPAFNDPARRSITLRDLFEALSVGEICAAAGVTASQVISAIPSDENEVHAALFNRAARDADTATMELLIEARLSGADAKVSAVAPSLAILSDKLSETVSEQFARTLLDSSALRARLQQFQEAETPAALKDDGTLVFTVLILPVELIPPFIESLAALSPVTTRGARDVAEMILALSNASNPQR